MKRAEARGKSAEGSRVWDKAKEMTEGNRVERGEIGGANERIGKRAREGPSAGTEMAVQRGNVRLLRTTFELLRTNNDIYETFRVMKGPLVFEILRNDVTRVTARCDA